MLEKRKHLTTIFQSKSPFFIYLCFLSFLLPLHAAADEIYQQGFNRRNMSEASVPLRECKQAQDKGLFLGIEKRDTETAFGKGGYYIKVFHLYENKLYVTAHNYFRLKKPNNRSDVLCYFYYEKLDFRR